MVEAFRKADEVLLNAVKGISDLITFPGLINVDFADVRTIMAGMGLALMGTGVGVGRAPRDRGRRAGDQLAAARRRLDRRRDRHPDQHHRRPGPHAVRGQRGEHADPGGGPRGREHHLRLGHRSEPQRRGPHHRDRHRLRSQREARDAARAHAAHADEAQLAGRPALRHLLADDEGIPGSDAAARCHRRRRPSSSTSPTSTSSTTARSIARSPSCRAGPRGRAVAEHGDRLRPGARRRHSARSPGSQARAVAPEHEDRARRRDRHRERARRPDVHPPPQRRPTVSLVLPP